MSDATCSECQRRDDWRAVLWVIPVSVAVGALVTTLILLPFVVRHLA